MPNWACPDGGKSEMPEVTAIDEMVAAFGAYESAIERAQRMYHNYQEWTHEEYEPIEAARNRFHEAAQRARTASPKART